MSFEELIKKYESSMAVPMYPKALVIDFMKKAYEAGMKADAHTDNSAVIAELEAQIEKMKCDVKQEQSYWNTCDMQYDLYQRLLDEWEIKEND